MRPHRDCGGDRDLESEMHQQHLQKRVVERCQLEFAATSPTTLCRSGRWQSRCRCEDGGALEAQEPAVRRAARSVRSRTPRAGPFLAAERRLTVRLRGATVIGFWLLLLHCPLQQSLNSFKWSFNLVTSSQNSFLLRTPDVSCLVATCNLDSIKLV